MSVSCSHNDQTAPERDPDIKINYRGSQKLSDSMWDAPTATVSSWQNWDQSMHLCAVRIHSTMLPKSLYQLKVTQMVDEMCVSENTAKLQRHHQGLGSLQPTCPQGLKAERRSEHLDTDWSLGQAPAPGLLAV